MSREYHPLSQRHYEQVIVAGRRDNKALRGVWGLTWNLRGQTLFKLGTASAMAMSFSPEAISLFCVSAQLDPRTGGIHYAQVRMAHDFQRNPRPGVRGPVLDPRETGEAGVRRRDRPNGSWVRLGLDLHSACRAATRQNWRLPVVPRLPRFLAGFQDMQAIDAELTPAIVRDIAKHLGKTPEQVAGLPHEEQMLFAKSMWPELWSAPGCPGNDTKLWLIDTKYTTRLTAASCLYEDFSQLVGVNIENPVRSVKQVGVYNPTTQLASEHGIDLNATFQSLLRQADAADVQVTESDDQPYNAAVDGDEVQPMTPTTFSCSYDEAIDNIIRLRGLVRQHLGAIEIDDAAIDRATLNPAEPLIVQVTPEVLRDYARKYEAKDTVDVLRAQLECDRLSASSGTTDEDLLRALESPASPLYASRLCQQQILRRDMRLEPEDTFQFSPELLERDRVYARFWPDDTWSPPASRKSKKVAAHDAEQRGAPGVAHS